MRIRAFEPDDAEGVASLWQYWFKDKTRVPDPALTSLVRRIYVEDPNVDDEITSLIAEEDDGTLLGFLGVSVMPVMLDGSEAKMAGVFPSVVAPEASTTVASLLLRRFLTGPQAFTFSDGGHVKFERIWEALGGQIAQAQSLRWVRLFRPAEVASSSGGVGRALGPFGSVAQFLARGGDRLARPLAGGRLVVREQADLVGYSVEELTPPALVDVSAVLKRRVRMRPVYTERHTTWLFGEMSKIDELGEFSPRLVRAPNGEPVGWFVYYMKPGGISRVFVLEAADKHKTATMDLLFRDADSRGAGALIGRFEPRLRSVIAERVDIISPKGSLQMVHSKDPSLMADAQIGRLAYSRLQGENWYWWALDSDQVP